MAAQGPPPVIRVEVPLVTLEISVTDADGRPITTLTKDDFLVFENEQPQVIQVFAPVGAPYSVFILVDRSASMGSHWPIVRPALGRLLARLRPQDRVAIGAFDERTKDVDLLVDWREIGSGHLDQIAINPVIRGEQELIVLKGDRREPDRSLRREDAAVMTIRGKDFYAALEWALKRMGAVEGRRGMVVFTDGNQPGTQSKAVSFDGLRYRQLVDPNQDGAYQRVLQTSHRSKVLLYFVAVDTDLNLKKEGFSLEALHRGIAVRSRLEQLAKATGGRVATPRNVEDVLTLFDYIGRQLGTSYTLGYVPINAAANGGFRRIAVRTRDATVQIHQSREGYMSP